MLIIGLMSGTSIDGVDASLVEVDEKETFKEIDNYFLPYDEKTKNLILNSSKKETSNVQMICGLNVKLGYIYTEAIKLLLNKAQKDIKDISFVAMHGQTIWHNPEHLDGYDSSTLQVGDPSIIAYQLNILVISNFRPMDMAAGGCGAPLVPFVNYVLNKKETKKLAFQNIGGISNVTYIKPQGTFDDIIAFDTGPGNMLIDSAMQILYQLPYDESGNVASMGKINENALKLMLNDEYLKKSYPKSCGRELYNDKFLEKFLNLMPNETKENIITTITAYTAYCIKNQYDRFLPDVDQIILSGGGAKNNYLVNLLKTITKKEVMILPKSDSYEAFCFAILGYYTYHHLPSNVRSVTNAKDFVILGQFTYPPRKKEENE